MTKSLPGLMTKLLLYLFLCLPVTCLVASEASVPPSISIVYVTSDIEGSGQIFSGDLKLLGIKVQLVTELSQNYECYINLRVNGVDIAAEQALESLKNLRTSASSEVRLAAADYVVGIYTRSGPAGGDPIIGSVLCVNTETGDTNTIKRVNFSVNSITEIPSQAAKAVAEILSLKKKPQVDKVDYIEASKHVWSILPIARIDKGKSTTVSDEQILITEFAIQEKIGAGKVVERRVLEKILREHKIGAIRSCADIQYLAKMVNADRFVVGQVGPWDNGLRVDVQVVDAGTATILGGWAMSNVSEKDLDARVAECVLSAVRASSGVVALPVASMEQRRREAEWFRNKAFYPTFKLSFLLANNRAFLDYASAVDGLEGAYLLVHDDPALAYQVIRELAIRLDDASRMLYFAYKGMNATSRAAALINFAAAGMSSCAETPSPLLLQASALVSMLEYDKAMKLVERHMTDHPGIDRCDALILKGRCIAKANKAVVVNGGVYASLETLKKTLALFQEAQKTGQDTRLSSFTVQHWLSELDEAMKNVASKTGLDEAKKLGEGKEYEYYGKMFSPEGPHRHFKYSDWKRFLELLEKRETPENIVKLKAHKLQGMSDDVVCCLPNYLPPNTPPFRSVFDLWFLQSRSYLAMGRKTDAVRRLRDIEYCGKTGNLPVDAESAKKLADSIEAESGPVQELWKTGAQVIVEPSPYQIYIIPASFDKRLLTCISSNLNEFFGLNVKMLPNYQIQPQDKIQGDTINRLGEKFLRNVMLQTAIPDDALYVMVITGEPIIRGAPLTARKELLGSETAEGVSDNPVLIPIDCSRGKPNPNMNELLRDGRRISCYIIRGFQCLYDWSLTPAHGSEYAGTGWHTHAKRCYNTPCVFSSEYLRDGTFRLKMCPECQGVYRKIDYDAVHKNLMQTLKKLGAKIVKVEK